MSDLQLIEAVKTGKLANVEEALNSGADIHQQDEQGWTPLNWAAGRGDLDIVRLLLDRGADVFSVGRDQRTPYKIALAARHAEVVELLMQAEEKVSGKSSNSLRNYAKAYPLGDLRKFSGWREEKINWKESIPADQNGNSGDGLSDNDIVFLHQDFTITQFIWPGENVIFNQSTPEWLDFCARELQFKVPDDLDLIAPTQQTATRESA